MKLDSHHQGDVTGPSAATNEQIVVFNSTTGKLIKASGATCNATGDGVFNSLSAGGYLVIDKSIFNANTVLAADTDNAPTARTVAEQTLLGRITSGNIAALTSSQALGIIAESLKCYRYSGRDYDGAMWGMTATSSDKAATADRIDAHRFWSWGETYDAIGIQVRTAEAGKGVKLAIYNEGSSGLPGTLVYQTAALSLDSTGVVEETSINQALAAGWYWVALLSDSAGTARFESATVTYDRLLGAADPGSNAYTYITKTGELYANGFDDPFPAGANPTTSSTIHRIVLTVA